MFCEKCGKELPEGAKFCEGCGAPVGGAPAKETPKNSFEETVKNLGNTADVTGDFDAADIAKNKVLALFAYIGILFLIPLLAAPNSKFARFHTNQGLVLFITGVIWGVISGIVNLIVGGVPVLVQGDVKKGFVTEAEDLAPYVTERTKALILNSPNNPNGCIWNREQLAGIAKLAVEKGFYVVSDEIYEKLIYDGEEHVSIASLGEDIFKQTIVINGVSKSYAMTGWRIGYTAGPTEVIKAMSSLQSQVASGSNSIAQYAAEEALRSPKGPEEIERMHKAYDERRRYLLREFRVLGMDCFEPYGAFYMFPCIKRFGMTSDEFANRLLQEEKLALVPGTAFGDCGEGYLRVSYAYSLEDLQKAIERIKRFVARLDGEKKC